MKNILLAVLFLSSLYVSKASPSEEFIQAFCNLCEVKEDECTTTAKGLAECVLSMLSRYVAVDSDDMDDLEKRRSFIGKRRSFIGKRRSFIGKRRSFIG